MKAAREFAERHGQHVTLLVGVVAEHGSIPAEDILVDMLAVVMTLPDMPLMVNSIEHDCLQTSPGPGEVHVELVWISV